MDVVINGVTYHPKSETVKGRIGIAISTRNRQAVLEETLKHHEKFLPAGAVFVVVDDGSAQPVTAPDWVTVVRHPESLGIPAVKNKSLEVLIDAGCDELFLWDDDAYPIAKDWHLPYIESPEPHLGYQFLDLAGPRKLKDITVLFNDGKYVAYSGQRGVMLYYHKSAIDVVGGFDPIYGKGMYEHVDLASRIHFAGLTTCAFGDVVGSNQLIHSLDEHEAVQRSVPPAERQAQVSVNAKIYNDRRDTGYAGYAPYRVERNVAITVLLTGCKDPQRGVHMQADATLLAKWENTVRGCERIVLADQLETLPKSTLVKVPVLTTLSPYFARWVHVYQYLRDNPDIKTVWVTDGTDVEMLREPWAEMEPGKLYVGSEHSTYANPWFDKVNHHAVLKQFIAENRDQQVLNAGLIGGDRETVMKVAHAIFSIHWVIKSKQFWKTESQTDSDTDMVMFGIALKPFRERLVYGPKVNTVFKTEGHGSDYAWFKHK